MVAIDLDAHSVVVLHEIGVVANVLVNIVFGCTAA